MKTIFHIANYALCAFVFTVLAGCQEDKDYDPSQLKGDIVGEWLDNSSSDDTKLYSVETLNADGTMTNWFAFVNKTNSIYKTTEGTYTYTSDIFTETKQSITGEGYETDQYNVLYLDGLSMTVYHSETSSVTTFQRIVSTYDMIVGESKLCVIEDLDFVPMEYASSEPNVATIDESGTIHAIKRGISFISVSSSEGTAIVRVVVTDPENAIDDYLKLIGSSIDDLPKIYGNNYVSTYANPFGVFLYNVFDENVSTVAFYYSKRKVSIIQALFREEADINLIMDSLRKKYPALSDSKSVSSCYASNNGIIVYIQVDATDRTITFMTYTAPPEPEEPNFSDEDYQQFDGIINLTAEEAAKALGYELTEEDWEDGSFNVKASGNAIFETVSINFENEEEPYEVQTVIMRCNSGIDQEDVEPWYKEHYQATGDELNPYSNEGNTFYIRFKKSGSRLYVYYSKRKARK